MDTALFTSHSSEWETPQYLFDQLDEEFHFTLDPCATDENHKCAKYFTKKDDGILQDWGNDIVFMNPPYGREIGEWIRKAYFEGGKTTVVCLIPSRTDTKWWHNYCMRGEIRLIKGRLKFKNRTLPSYREDGNYKISAAPFPSAIVIFNPLPFPQSMYTTNRISTPCYPYEVKK